MAASQILEPYYRYESLYLIRPQWNWRQKMWNTIQAYTSFFHHRINTLLYLFLGGAMKYIGTALKQYQSTCLFLDVEFPISRMIDVKLFSKKIPISSGPVWLAQNYKKTNTPYLYYSM